MLQLQRFLVVASLASAFNTVAHAQDSTATPSIERVWVHGSSFGETRAALLAKFGAPTRTHVDTFANPYRKGLDSIVVLEFRQLHFWIRIAGEREFLQYVFVERDGYSIGSRIIIGRTSEADVRLRYGSPDGADTHGDTLRLRYVGSGRDEAEEYVVFTFVRGLLRRVAWDFNVD